MRQLALCLILLFPCLSQGQTPPGATPGTEPERPKIRLEFKLDCHPPIDADIVRSYYMRELRQLTDVDLVQDMPDIIINALIIPSKNERGNLQGYVVSYAVTSGFGSYMALAKAKNNVSPDVYKELQYWLNDNPALINHFVVICGPEHLQEEIVKNVAKLDGSDIEILRRMREKYNVDF